MWLNLAVSRLPFGDARDTAVKLRESVAARMTVEQIAQAQKMSRDWKPKQSE
jgi:hypothetical protein